MGEAKRQSQIVFFLGAGASVYAGVPDTYSFVELFKKHLPANKREIIEQIEAKLSQWKKARKEDERVDIELLMETLERLTKKDDEFLLEFAQGEKPELDFCQEAPELLEDLKNFVKAKSIVKEEEIRYLEHLLDFLDEGQLDIFSVNYDICIEQLCSLYQKSYRDGFDVEWNPKVFDHEDIDVRLFKLHGSITWYKSETGYFLKSLVETNTGKIKLVFGQVAESVMLYPMRKWEYVEPLLENLLMLKNRLQSNECKYVFVIGYSFRDDHIRNIFWDAVRKNKLLTVILVDPNAYDIYKNKLQYYNPEEKIKSSLYNRVVCIAGLFEAVLPVLKIHFLRAIRMALGTIENNRRTEIAGEKPYWPSAVEALMLAEHIDKAKELLVEKIDQRFGKDLNPDLVKRTAEIRLFTLSFRTEKLIDLFFEQALTYLIQKRLSQSKIALRNLVTILNLAMVNGIHVVVSGDQLEISFNYFPSGDGIPLLSISDLGARFNRYISTMNSVRYEGMTERSEILLNFIDELCEYLEHFKTGRISITDYIVLREPNFPEKCALIKEEKLRAIVVNAEKQEISSPEKVISNVTEIEKDVLRSILKSLWDQL